jgi:hypothetical protein
MLRFLSNLSKRKNIGIGPSPLQYLFSSSDRVIRSFSASSFTSSSSSSLEDEFDLEKLPLPKDSHYALIGVPVTATKKDIRDRFYMVSFLFSSFSSSSTPLSSTSLFSSFSSSSCSSSSSSISLFLYPFFQLS